MTSAESVLDISQLWPWIAVLVVAVIVAVATLIYLRRTKRQRRIKRGLKRLGNRWLKGVLIPDGLGGQIQVDYVGATPYGLVVLDFSEMDGVLFGGERLDQWSAVHSRTTYRFRNPLYDNSVRTVSVRELAGDVPVFGWVAFHADTSFPKGMPEGVTRIDELLEALEQRSKGNKPATETIDVAWQAITAAAIPLEK